MKSFMLALFLSLLSDPSPHFALHIDKVNNDQVLARPYVAPALIFHIEEGKVTEKDVLNCSQEEIDSQFSEHADTFVILKCGSVRLKLRGIYLGQ